MELLYVSAVVLAFAVVWRAVAIKARERGWPLLGRHLTGIGVGMIAGMAAVLVIIAVTPKDLTLKNVQAPPNQLAEEAKSAPRKQYVSARAKELFDEYHANEVAADLKYKGRDVLIVGTVQSIDKNVLNNVVVRLSTRNKFQPVSVTLKRSNRNAAAAFKKGDILTFDCKGDGMLTGSPSMKECDLFDLKTGKPVASTINLVEYRGLSVISQNHYSAYALWGELAKQL